MFGSKERVRPSFAAISAPRRAARAICGEACSVQPIRWSQRAPAKADSSTSSEEMAPMAAWRK